jgi:hypothetical protein
MRQNIANLYDLGRLMINQGMRPEEVLSISKFDVNLDRWQLQIPRGSQRRPAVFLT